MNNVVIDYNHIVALIKEEFAAVKETNASAYDTLNFIISEEQQFVKKKEIDPKNVYVVIKFGEATINFGQSVAPVRIQVFGPENRLELIREFLNVFVNTYNLFESENIQQLFLMPQVLANFQPISTGYRSLININGTVVVKALLTSVGTLEYFYDGVDGPTESLELVSFQDVTSTSLNPQPYPDTYGRTKSYGLTQTYAFSCIVYNFADSKLLQDIRRFKYKDADLVNKDWVFSLVLNNPGASDAGGFEKWVFKCKGADLTQKLGDTPVMALSFTL